MDLSDSMKAARSYLILSILAVATLSGCVSTEKRFEQAVNYEEEGNYIRAARYYLDVLKREPDMGSAREGLIRTGAIAVGNYMDQAKNLELGGAFDDAISVLDDLDAFRAEAAGTGVNLELPLDYANYRDRLAASAVNALIDQARVQEQQGDWEEAISLYDRVLNRYAIDVEQTEMITLSKANVYVQWGAREIERSYFRSAYTLGGKAIEILGESHPRAVAAFDLQDRALAEGTQYITFFPTTIPDDPETHATVNLMQEFNDIMLYEFWGAPPFFIATTDPLQMRRELRRSSANAVLTPLQAIQIGQLLEADYVLLSRADQIDLDELRVREKTIDAKTRGRNSLDTTYVQQSYTARLTAKITYSLIEVESREEVESGTFSFDVSQRMERGIYTGDYQDLDLSYNEQRLFDEEELKEDIRNLEDELLDGLAPRFADEVFEEILSQIN